MKIFVLVSIVFYFCNISLGNWAQPDFVFSTEFKVKYVSAIEAALEMLNDSEIKKAFKNKVFLIRNESIGEDLHDLKKFHTDKYPMLSTDTVKNRLWGALVLMGQAISEYNATIDENSKLKIKKPSMLLKMFASTKKDAEKTLVKLQVIEDLIKNVQSVKEEKGKETSLLSKKTQLALDIATASEGEVVSTVGNWVQEIVEEKAESGIFQVKISVLEYMEKALMKELVKVFMEALLAHRQKDLKQAE